jgi:urease subunit alpha
MVRNDALPHIEVDAQTHDVFADGKRLWVEPVAKVPLARRFLLR